VKRLVVALILLAAAGAQAASLKELLAAAEEKNLDRRMSQETRRKAAAELTAAWTGLAPSLTAQGTWTNNQFPVSIQFAPPPAEPLVLTPKNQFDGIIRAEVPLIDTTRWFRLAAASASDAAAEQREELVLDSVRRQVSITYYSLAASLAFRESAKRSLGVAEAQLKLQDIREKAGAATELEVLRARAEVQRNKQTLADAESAVANTRRALSTICQSEVGEDAVLPADDLKIDGDLAQLEDVSGDTAMVQSAVHDAEAAAAAANIYRYSLVPMVTGNFTERLTNATGFNGQWNSYTFGVGLVWRLDGPTVFNIKAQAAQASAARLQAEKQRLAARDQVHTDWRRLTAAVEKVTAAQAQVQAAQRAAQVARDRYVAGAATQIDVIQSERDLFGAEVNQIQARTELASSHVSLRISAGLPLQL
jgi:outer membrane protein TolC